MESFTGRIRDEFLSIDLVSSLPEAKVLAEPDRIANKVYRPQYATGTAPAMESGLTTHQHSKELEQQRWVTSELLGGRGEQGLRLCDLSAVA